jgi:tetratricopeptide (TPR) repeat protein
VNQVDSPMCILSPAIEPCNNYFERQSATFADIRSSLASHGLIYITGKHGMGKTQLAKEYVHRAQEAKWYKGFFWIDVGMGISARSELYHLSVALKIGRARGENAITALKRELSQRDQWLLVIDNYDNTYFDIIRLLSPFIFTRHVIAIMHRDTPLPPFSPFGPPMPIGFGPPPPIGLVGVPQPGPPPGVPLPIGPPAPVPPPPIPAPIPFPPIIAPPPMFMPGWPLPPGPLGPLPQGPPTPPLTMLPPLVPQNAFHLGPLDARDSEDLFVSIYTNGQEQSAITPLDNILDELGHIPLSIEIAAIYLRETGEDIVAYTHNFKTFKERMMKSMLAQDDSYISAASALAISLQRLQSCPETLRLLSLLAFLGSSCIPLWIFTADPRFRDVPLRGIFFSQEALNNVISPLLLFGLVKRIDNNHAISMNRVVQNIIRDFIELESGNGKAKSTPLSITDESTIYWIERAAELMYICYPTLTGAQNLKILEALNPHVIEVVQHCDDYAVVTKEYGVLQASLGSYQKTFEHEVEMPLYHRALQTFEALYGPDHIDTSQIVEIIADTAHLEGKYEIALKYNERAMEIQEVFFGTNHVAVLQSILERGNIYVATAKAEEAIFQFRLFLRMCEKVIGTSTMKTRDARFVLSREYYRQGKYVEGRKQVEIAVDSFMHSLEKAPFDILWMMKHVARSSLDRQKYDEAIAQFKRILDIQDKASGTPIADLKDTFQSLGAVYHLNKDYSSALEQYERLLKVVEEDEGTNPKDIARAMSWLANIYIAQHNYENALQLNERQLSLLEDKFGVDAVETASAIKDIALVYEHQKKYPEALERYRQVVRIYETEYGPNVTILFDALYSISGILFLQCNIQDSLNTDMRSLRLLPGGLEVVSLANVYQSAAMNNQWLGRVDAAMALMNKALGTLQGAFGVYDVRTILPLERIAYLHGVKRNFQTAWTIYQGILSVKDAAFGKDSLNHCSTLRELTRFYHQQAKHDDALKTCKRILRIQRAALPTANVNMAETIREIGYCYHHKGKYELALKHKLSALRMEEKSEDYDVVCSAQTVVSIGCTYISMGKYEDALREFRKSLEVRQKAPGPNHFDIANSYDFIGDTYYEQMNYDDAMTAYNQGLAIRDVYLGHDNIFAIRTYTKMGKATYGKGDATAAIDLYQKAMGVVQKFYGLNHVLSIDTMMNKAIAQCKLGQYETAIGTLTWALNKAEADYGPNNPEMSALIMNHAVTYMYLGKYNKAIRRLGQALALLEKAFGEDHQNTAETLMNMGRVLQCQKRYSEADEHFARCQVILHRCFGPDHPRTKKVMDQIKEIPVRGDDQE